jgi:hypothetical protein
MTLLVLWWEYWLLRKELMTSAQIEGGTSVVEIGWHELLRPLPLLGTLLKGPGEAHSCL